MMDHHGPQTSLQTGGTPPSAPGLSLAELLTVSDQTDEHGRLLLEDAAPPEAVEAAVRAGIPMETVRGRYDDPPSRQGAHTNQSAYEALRRDSGEVLRGLAWLARRHGEVAPAELGTVEALAELSKIGVTLPLPLLHRGDRPMPRYGALPSEVAAIFKASRGVFSATFDMTGGPKATSGPVTAEQVVAFADREGHLRRQETDRACAAPTGLIQRTVHVMLTGEADESEQSRLAQLLPFELLWQFHQLERTFSRGLSRYSALLEHATGNKRLSRRELFAQKVHLGGDLWTFGELTEQFLELAGAVQSDLNHLLGRDDPGPEVTFDDVLAAL